MSEAHVCLCQPSRPLPGHELQSSKPSKACCVALYTKSMEAPFEVSVAAQYSQLGCRESYLWVQAVLHIQHQSPADIPSLFL